MKKFISLFLLLMSLSLFAQDNSLSEKIEKIKSSLGKLTPNQETIHKEAPFSEAAMPAFYAAVDEFSAALDEAVKDREDSLIELLADKYQTNRSHVGIMLATPETYDYAMSQTRKQVQNDANAVKVKGLLKEPKTTTGILPGKLGLGTVYKIGTGTAEYYAVKNYSQSRLGIAASKLFRATQAYTNRNVVTIEVPHNWRTNKILNVSAFNGGRLMPSLFDLGGWIVGDSVGFSVDRALDKSIESTFSVADNKLNALKEQFKNDSFKLGAINKIGQKIAELKEQYKYRVSKPEEYLSGEILLSDLEYQVMSLNSQLMSPISLEMEVFMAIQNNFTLQKELAMQKEKIAMQERLSKEQKAKSHQQRQQGYSSQRNGGNDRGERYNGNETPVRESICGHDGRGGAVPDKCTSFSAFSDRVRSLSAREK